MCKGRAVNHVAKVFPAWGKESPRERERERGECFAFLARVAKLASHYEVPLNFPFFSSPRKKSLQMALLINVPNSPA